MLPGELVSFMVELATELGLLGGFIGAMLYIMVRGMVIAAWQAVEGSSWYLDWQDQRYVQSFNADESLRRAEKDLHVRRALRAQHGQITPAGSFWLVAVVLALLAACAAPEPPLTGSYHWWDMQREAAQRRGW